MTELRVCDGGFRAFLDAGFAGPKTTWRAVNVADGSTWEGCELGEVPAHGFAEAPAGTELVLDQNARALVLAPCSPGATLGELVDATAAEGARMDPSVAVRIVVALAPLVLRTPLVGVSLDHVLVGFDGAVLTRGHLPWWGPLPRARVPPDRRTFDDDSEALHSFGEVCAEIFTSKRWPPPGLVFPALPQGLRRKVRQQLRQLLENTTVTVRQLEDSDEDFFDTPMCDRDAVRTGLLALERVTPTATAAELGVLVQHVFAERWEREQRARAIVDAAMT